MNRTLKIGSGVALGAAAVAVAGMMATATPVATSLTSADPTPTASAGTGKDGGHVAETPLTGDDATKAKAAAEAAVSGGTVLRVETDSDGTYEAHVRKSDGTEVEVKMDKNFKVTSVEEFQGRGPGGHGGGGNGETPLTGDDATKATAAAKAAVSGGTVLRVETDSDGTYEAHVRKSDGTEVEVKMDKNFKVTSVEEFQGRGPGGHGGGGNGETPLTGDDATKATAAAKAAVAGGTVLRVETDSDGTYEAHVRKSDGTEVEVKMDKNFKVTSVEEFQGRGPGGHGDKDGRAADNGTDDGATASATPSA